MTINEKISEGMLRHWARVRAEAAKPTPNVDLRRKMKLRANAVRTSLTVAQFGQLYRELSEMRRRLSVMEQRATRLFQQWANGGNHG